MGAVPRTRSRHLGRTWAGWLVAPVALLGLGVTSAPAPPVQIHVVVDGTPVVIGQPATVGRALRAAGVRPRDGHLHTAVSGSTLAAAVDPAVLTRNGAPADLDTRVHEGDVVGSRDGRDWVEATVARTEAVPATGLPAIETFAWRPGAAGSRRVVVGARSALFLPFNNLGLIVVDEEHDSSFKQADPAPRYNARDAALVLSRMQRAKIILGSATPSFESYYNAQKDKYKLVHMPERVGDAVLPVTEVVDLKAFQRKRQMKHEFSPPLLAAIESTIQKGKQVILFQNRRGFSPYLHCKICDFHAQCVHCDVSLTYHKYFNKLVCHYCSYQTDIPKYCPDCGSDQLELKGFGTEKIEENLKILMPALRIGRMDLDTVKTVKAQEKILQDLELKRLDVVIGTQMVTKGLDFPGIGLVAILQVDQMLHYPDYRANERAYQLITQVSGRAGRKDSQGQVILQTYQPEHPVIQDVLKNHYQSFYAYEMLERKKFGYPPYTRQVLLVLKHKTAKTVFEGGKWLTRRLREKLPERVKGPSEPTVARVRNQYVRHVLITLDKRLEHLQQVKDFIENSISDLKAEEGFSTIRVNVDVDPY